MSYQVIARKYRPQRFEDVVGQEHVTQTLANAIRGGRIAHAYLFCGPRGTGKTTIARIFAKALNCTGGPRADFDEADPRCQEIAEGRSLDVLEIDGASNNGVEQVRELRETARFAPAASQFKIYIIDEVHMLTTAAFNALLKTLEEPPAHVKFLFATTDPEKVLPTILSRCQRFDLRRIPTALIVRHLAEIAGKEGATVDEAGLHAIARGADGGLRDAESTLDQLISFCGARIEEADVLSMFGLAARGQVRALSRAILAGDAAAALRLVDELCRGGKDLGRLLQDLLHHFRDLVVHHVTGGDAAMLDLPEAEAGEIARQAGEAPVDVVTRILDELTAAEGRFRDSTARRVFLEVTVMKAIQARQSVSLEAVLRRLQELRSETGNEGPAAAAAAVETAGAARQRAVPAAAQPAVASSTGTSIGTVAAVSGPVTVDAAGLWAQLAESATVLSRPALLAGQALSWERGVLTVGYPAAGDAQRTLVDSERMRKALEGRMAELGWAGTLKFVRMAEPEAGAASGGSASKRDGPVEVRSEAERSGSSSAGAKAAGVRTGEKRAAAAAAAPSKPVPLKLDPAEFKKDPLIAEALEIFRGQLVEVRADGEDRAK